MERGDLLLDRALAEPARAATLLPQIEASWLRAVAIGERPELRPFLPVIAYETLGRTLPDGAAAAAVLWIQCQGVAQLMPDSVRRAGHAGEGVDLGNALFDAILAAPDDDAPRLVYADALDDLGDAGRGRSAYIHEWFAALMDRMREVRVAVGDWQRVLTDSVTVRHGVTGVFLDPPYTKGEMDYAAGGVGGELADAVRAWCTANGNDARLRIVLCGHAGEHDALLQAGWHTRTWTARRGYAMTDEAVANSASETLWCSPHCVPAVPVDGDLFAEVMTA